MPGRARPWRAQLDERLGRAGREPILDVGSLENADLSRAVEDARDRSRCRHGDLFDPAGCICRVRLTPEAVGRHVGGGIPAGGFRGPGGSGLSVIGDMAMKEGPGSTGGNRLVLFLLPSAEHTREASFSTRRLCYPEMNEADSEPRHRSGFQRSMGLFTPWGRKGRSTLAPVRADS